MFVVSFKGFLNKLIDSFSKRFLLIKNFFSSLSFILLIKEFYWHRVGTVVFYSDFTFSSSSLIEIWDNGRVNLNERGGSGYD